MKKLSIIIGLILTLNLYAKTTANLEEASLEYIDNICGDSWCEGDFDYSFDKMKCNFTKKVCKLDFTFLYFEDSRDTNSNEQYKVNVSFKRSCILKGVNRKNMIDFKRQDLTSGFYQKVNDCISDREDKVIELLTRISLY